MSWTDWIFQWLLGETLTFSLHSLVYMSTLSYPSPVVSFSCEGIHIFISHRLQGALRVLLCQAVVLFYAWYCTTAKLYDIYIYFKAEHGPLHNVGRSQSVQSWANWHSDLSMLGDEEVVSYRQQVFKILGEIATVHKPHNCFCSIQELTVTAVVDYECILLQTDAKTPTATCDLQKWSFIYINTLQLKYLYTHHKNN